MKQGITTHYHGPTNTKGSRIQAIARKGKTWSDGTRDKPMQLSDHWNHSQGIEDNHTRCAKLLAAKLDWSGLWIGGGQPGESGFQFTNAGALTPGRIGEAGMIELGRENIDWFYVAPKRGA